MRQAGVQGIPSSPLCLETPYVSTFGISTYVRRLAFVPVKQMGQTLGQIRTILVAALGAAKRAATATVVVELVLCGLIMVAQQLPGSLQTPGVKVLEQGSIPPALRLLVRGPGSQT